MPKDAPVPERHPPNENSLNPSAEPPPVPPPDLTRQVFDIISSGKSEKTEGELKFAVTALSKELLSTLTEKYFVLVLWSDEAISPFHLDRIYQALKTGNLVDGRPVKPVLLILKSPGGQIGPAYTISKVCNELSKDKFIVCIPKEAKSAATLLSLGADEVHMGLLSELGPTRNSEYD